MGGAGAAVRLLALAVFVVAGAGVYAMVLKSDLKAAEVQLNTIAKDRDLYRTRVEQYASQSKDDTRSLASCEAQVTDLTAQLQAATAKPAGRR
ncbi:MAG: hypothetical protein AB7I36_12655 [Rhodospirillaceae bacterium]